ncbi:MAG: hypothetical protein ACR2OA_19515 [Rubripirellula sp.]
MTKRRFAIRILLTMVIATGLVCTVYLNLRLSSLREVHHDLQMRVGLFEEADSAKVRVVRAGVPEDLVTSEMSDGKIWRYRLSLPAKYQPVYQRYDGLVKADAPGGAGGSSRSWGSPNPEPSEIDFSVSFILDNGQWTLSVSHTGGGSSHAVPHKFPINSVDDLVIEQVVDFGVTRSFDADEPICLFRIREKNEALNRDGTKKVGLYRGFVFYLCENQSEKAFSAWASGQVSSMQEIEK